MRCSSGSAAHIYAISLVARPSSSPQPNPATTHTHTPPYTREFTSTSLSIKSTLPNNSLISTADSALSLCVASSPPHTASGYKRIRSLDGELFSLFCLCWIEASSSQLLRDAGEQLWDTSGRDGRGTVAAGTR